MEDEHHRISKRLEDVEKIADQILKITISVDRLATNTESMTKEIKKQGERLERLEKEPADKWNNFVKVIISAVASGLIGYVIGIIFT